MNTSNFLLHLGAILPATLLMSQCAPTEGVHPQTVCAVTPSSQHWTKVSARPPTFYPRGVGSDIPTDFKSGEWVSTGDAQDTHYFIPAHDCGGIPRQTLVNEALAARSGKMQRRIAVEDLESNAMRVIVSPFALIWGMCPL